tara:strand:- start:89 stop:595 length:507 start_codon:yes stop_codon:yes gene_type:complete
MKIFIIALHLIFYNILFPEISLAQIIESKFSCLFIDGAGTKTDKGFYLQILPENLSMIERNSILRDKNTGFAEIIAFNTWDKNAVSSELLYIFDIIISKNKSDYVNKKSNKFPHNFTMNRKTYALNIKNIYSNETLNYQCMQLNNNVSFTDLVLEHIEELQQLIEHNK